MAPNQSPRSGWSASVFAFYLVAGTHADQPPPPPMISGPILAAITAGIQLVSAPRFFRGAPETDD